MPIKAFLLVIVKIGGTNKKQKNNNKIWYTEPLELLANNIQPMQRCKQAQTDFIFRSVPVTAELQGMATIGGKTGELKMTIDYTSFLEVNN